VLRKVTVRRGVETVCWLFCMIVEIRSSPDASTMRRAMSNADDTFSDSRPEGSA